MRYTYACLSHSIICTSEDDVQLVMAGRTRRIINLKLKFTLCVYILLLIARERSC